MNIFGFGGLGLFILTLILIALSLVRRQRLAAWLLLIGAGLFLLLTITVYFQISSPYERLGLSIYGVLFTAIAFSLAGFVGLATRFTRRLTRC